MKKIIKWVLIIIAGIFILLTGAGILYVYPMLSMNPAGTGQTAGENIYALKNHIVSVFLIKTNSGYIMIDAGTGAERLVTSLKDINIDANDVKWILLTHSDADHTAALALFPGAEIYMGKDELPLINGGAKRSFFGGNKMPPGVDINRILLLQDGQELSFGGAKIECIEAPGHTTGSMVYLLDGRYLFTGDAFKVNKNSVGVHPFTMDAALSKRTMEKLKTIISSSVVLTGHYGYFENISYTP